MNTDVPVSESRLIIPSRLEYLASVRELIETASRGAGFPPLEIQHIITAALEAVVNAVTHGSPLSGENQVSVEVRVYPDRLVIEVTDQGAGFRDLKPRKMPDVRSPRGRGIPLMRALMDDVQLSANGGGKVILTKRRKMRDD